AAGVSDRAHFLALAARAMRQLMLNHARDRVALKRGAGVVALDVDEHADSIAAEARDLIELDTVLARLEIEDASLARVVECRLFAGMTDSETADALGLPLRSAQRLWSQARQRLAQLLDAA
ncbi:MAG: ECF-type sigma factor, partial [Dokdonella sp.]